MALGKCGVVTDQKGWEMRVHGTPLFPVGCYHNKLTEDQVPWHWHDELEAVRVSEGQVIVSAEGGSWTMDPGEGFFINSGVLHEAHQLQKEPVRLHSIVFHPRLVGGSVESIFWQGYLQPLLSDPASRFVRLSEAVPWQKEALETVEAAWQSCAQEPPGFEFTVREELSRLVFLLSGHRSAARERPTEKALRDGERIKTMLLYIQEHCGGELTVAEIAGSAAVSESECLRCFKSMIGATPIQYVKQLRIQRAAELLASTDEKIADIGAECGFQEMSYFARTFRALKGRTPSRYRAEKRAASGAPASTPRS